MELRMKATTILHVRRSSFFPRSTPIPLPPLKSPIKTISVSVGGKKRTACRRASSGYRMVTSSPFCRISAYRASSSIKRIDSHSSRTARIDLPLFVIRETKRVCAGLDMAQVQRERNLREMNSPSTCGPRRAATIVSVIGRGCQVWLSLRIQHRYRSSLDRSCISRDSLVVATQSQRGGRSFLPPLLSDQPGQPPPSDRDFCVHFLTPGITCTRRKTQARVRNNEFRSQRVDRKNCRVGRFVSLSFPLAPGRSRGTNHTPTTHQHTHRRTTLFSRSSSSLVVLHIPNTPSRYTSTDPLLRTQSQVIQ